MEAKNLALPEQLMASRRKVASGFGLGVVGASMFALTVFLLSDSPKGPLGTAWFQGFDTASVNTSRVSWPFSFSSYSSFGGNGSTDTKEVQTSLDFVRGNGGFGNLTDEGRNGSFQVEELRHEQGTLEANGQVVAENISLSGSLEKTHVSNLPEMMNDGSLFGKEGRMNVNFSLSAKNVKANKSIEGRFGEDHGDVNHTVTKIYNVGNLSGNVELGESSPAEEVREEKHKMAFSNENCDIFDGKWVWDDSKPYYPEGSCPYIDRAFNCYLNKRPDVGFVKWRWQPNGCDIPSLNATDFLERMRGKKLVFVGDSLNRNMWESLVCILRNSVKRKKRVYEISGRTEFKKKGFYAFRFEDYNCTVDFVGSPFLVRESSYKGRNGSFETLRLDLMDQTTSMYLDADIIIFNTGHWWTHEKTSRGEDYYQEGNHVHRRLKALEAYKRALTTWARWIDKNIDNSHTQVFFRGYSVTHFRGGQWNSGGQCHKETEPIFNKTYLGKYPSKMRALEHVLQEMKTPVTYLNISRLTDYRKDGHPSIYRMEYKTPEEQTAAERSQDCSHWCLPGVPDTWNELLYASLLKAGRGSWRI